MAATIDLNEHRASWQSLKHFDASTTASEKVWRVVNHLFFAVAGCSFYAITRGKIYHAPLPVRYISYVSLAWAAKKIFAVAIGYGVYPAILIAFFKGVFRRTKSIEEKKKTIQKLQANGYITQEVLLHKSGTTYAATLIGHQDLIGSGKWSIHALGSDMAMEGSIESISLENRDNGTDTLLINGPGVGRSQGYPTSYQMGAGFEAGLQLLEKEVKATRIALVGFSLGGGMMSEAVLAHEFDSCIQYLGISDRTFSRLSDAAAAIVGKIVCPVFYLLGIELDGVAAAEKLKKLGIEHIIIQHHSENNQGTDGVIPDRAGLAAALERTDSRTFLASGEIPHQAALPDDIQKKLNEKIKEFFGKA